MFKTFAVAKNVRMSPRKVRLVLDLIRNQKATEAVETLRFVQKAAARPVLKVLESALANAEHNHKLEREQMIIVDCYADMGPTIHRATPRAMGRAHPIRKRTSHIWIYVSDGKLESGISNLEFGKKKDKKDKKNEEKKSVGVVDKTTEKPVASNKRAFLAKKANKS